MMMVQSDTDGKAKRSHQRIAYYVPASCISFVAGRQSTMAVETTTKCQHNELQGRATRVPLQLQFATAQHERGGVRFDIFLLC